jgi:putative transposase
MKTIKFTEEQILALLKEADTEEKTVTELCREHGIAESTYYKWRKQYRGMDVKQLKDYRRLIQENTRLKQLLADAMLKVEALSDVVKKL